jgi:hypothetical protein
MEGADMQTTHRTDDASLARLLVAAALLAVLALTSARDTAGGAATPVTYVRTGAR